MSADRDAAGEFGILSTTTECYNMH